MPIEETLINEKKLRERAEASAEGITEFLKDEGVEESTGFVLLMVDFENGLLQYISDMHRERAMAAMKEWIRRHEQ